MVHNYYDYFPLMSFRKLWLLLSIERYVIVDVQLKNVIVEKLKTYEIEYSVKPDMTYAQTGNYLISLV